MVLVPQQLSDLQGRARSEKLDSESVSGRGVQPSIPTRSRAALAIMVIAHSEAKPTCGASVRTNSRRHDYFWAAIA